MKFSELENGQYVFIDANVFIYNFSGHSTECKEFLSRCARGELTGYTLTSTIAEVLHRLMIAEAIEKGYINGKNPVKSLRENPETIKRLTIYGKDVQKIGDMNIKILDLTKEIILESITIRQMDGLLTNDSLLLCAMKKFDVLNLATNDADFDKVNWIKVYKPGDL